MRGSVKILATCLFVAFGCFNDVACYNPYAYKPRFFPISNADSFASMGDVGWAKRSFEDEPAPASSMEALVANPKRTYFKSYKYRQPYMLPYDTPYQAYARFGSTIARPQTRKLSDKAYSYASMADMDWGWKKRSQLPALLDLDDIDKLDEDSMTSEEKRNIAALAKSNLYPKQMSLRSLAKRLYEGETGADPDQDIAFADLTDEEKRHVASLIKKRSGVRGPWSMVNSKSDHE